MIGIPWAAAFVLGAIVAPTDPVAAEAIFRGPGVPFSLCTVVGGESLVNDATAIVIYQLAVAVAIGEAVSVADAAGRFVVVGLGGAAAGLLLGFVAFPVWRRLREQHAGHRQRGDAVPRLHRGGRPPSGAGRSDRDRPGRA